MQDIKIVLIQSDIAWENIHENLLRFDRKIAQIDQQPDLIVLPEMFSTGFTMNVDSCAETENGLALSWMKQKAKELNSILTGSLLISDQGQYFNRMFWVNPDGCFEFYNKRHLFSMANEQESITQGKARKITGLNGWNFNLQICYDLRFPVWGKNTLIKNKFEYDVLIYVANWPEVRSHAYKTLLIARAIENQAFVIWVNRVGYDNNRIYHSGDSMVVDPFGKIVFQAAKGNEEILYVTLSRQALDDFRNRFRFGQDWDKFTVQV
jgi:predicted amidohydrolase